MQPRVVSPTRISAGGNRFIHTVFPQVHNGQLSVATWNVEGLTDIKLHEVKTFMLRYSISITCMQETRVSQSPYYSTEDGFFVICSGSGTKGREYAGVVFLVAPWVKASIFGFLQHSSRLACLKLRVPGGKMAVISAYAPHSGHSFDTRQAFFEELGDVYSRTSVNGPKLVCGDFNARIQRRLPGEHSFVGDHVFGHSQARLELSSNRELLIETCASYDLAVANTFFEHPPERQATFRNIGVHPAAPVTFQNYAVLDLFLMRQDCIARIVDVASLPEEPLASHHFAVVATFDRSLMPERLRKNSAKARLDVTQLKSDSIAQAFAGKFESLLPIGTAMEHGDINEISSQINKAFSGAAQSALRSNTITRQKPWISNDTLALIDQRRRARALGNHEEELQLHKEVKRAARRDRRIWLLDLASSGSWNAARRLRTGAVHSQGRLNDENGSPISSELRAERFAKHLEEVQWKVRPAKLTDDAPTADPMPVNLEAVTVKELRKAVNALKNGKAAGPDGTPVDFWKVVLNNDGSRGAQWLLDFCNEIWSSKTIPSSWHLQQVTLIYKKGDPANCDNYRPICLLAGAYKVFAMVLLNRLLDAGADSRLSPSQYGFRKRRGTEDALHCVRRAIELTWAHRDGRMHVMALDWRKAFDSINPTSLLKALRTFGIPQPFVDMIESIYTGRTFQVQECGFTSSLHEQLSGICQGCPLSPFLFIVVMTVLMDNARKLLSPNALAALQQHQLFEVLYADDTILLGTTSSFVEEFAAAVEAAGADFGMSLHWDKTHALSIRSDYPLHGPDGKVVVDTGSLVYLGGLISADGRADSEISRRLGMAVGDYRSLQKMWGHANISRQRKLQLLHSLVISKLLYGLATMWLVTTQRRRLDGFYARALRRVLGIPAAFISRVSNKTVFQKAGVTPLSEQLLHRQLVLLGKVARAPEADGLRADVFEGSTFKPLAGTQVRRVGRPRQDWTSEVWKAGVQRFGNASRMESLLLGGEEAWRSELRNLFEYTG